MAIYIYSYIWVLVVITFTLYSSIQCTCIIDSFVAKVWRNVRGQYQFKTAEVTSDLSASMFFGGIDLYSVHWVHKANHNLASSRCYSDFAKFTIVDFVKLTEIWFQGVTARVKIHDAPNGRCTKLSIIHVHCILLYNVKVITTNTQI